jgi:hypothetical protein
VTILFANDAISTLAASITDIATSCQLSSGTGALFPDPVNPGDYFVMSFNDAETGLLTEIVHVTSISGDTVETMVRAQEGTSAQSWTAGDLAQNRWTAGQAGDMVQYVNYNPTRIVTTSGAFSISAATDFSIGLLRSASPGVSNATLPSNASENQPFQIQDLYGNFNAYPVTIQAPAGFNIANLSEVVLQTNRMTAEFLYYGSNTYGVSGL